MLLNSHINKIVTIKEFHCKIDSELKYYSNKMGKIKGSKTLQSNLTIYLIEFTNHNRIWARRDELEFS